MLDGKGLRIGIVVSRFNDLISERLLQGTLDCLVRHGVAEKEITVALDPNNNNPGYRLGRLFAVLEKIQEDAQPGINATIRDRYYGAASSNPVTDEVPNHSIAMFFNILLNAVGNITNLSAQLHSTNSLIKSIPSNLNKPLQTV